MCLLRRTLAPSLAFLVGLPAMSSGLSVSPNPITFDVLNRAGTVTFIGAATGLPEGGVTLVGTPGAEDMSLIFQMTLERGFPVDVVLQQISRDSELLGFSGAGWIPGDEPDELADLAAVFFPFNPSLLRFVDPSPLPPLFGLVAGKTSNEFFASYSSLAVGDEVVLAFPTGGVVGSFEVRATVVPEPSTALLLATGLAGLAVRRRGLG